MKHKSLAAFLLALILPTLALGRPAREEWDKLSPFWGMREAPSGLEVQVLDDRWYELVALGPIKTDSLIDGAKDFAGSRWWKRITEDLVEVLAHMGHRFGNSVDLTLRDPEPGPNASRETIFLEDVRMTKANRTRLHAANKTQRTVNAKRNINLTSLAKLDAIADLEHFRKLLDERFSYRLLRDINVEELFASAHQRVNSEPITRDALTLEIDRILRAFGDGHSRIKVAPFKEPGFLPFLIDKARGGYVAFHEDRSRLLDNEHSFIVAVDGRPLAEWLESSAKRSTQGSSQMVARAAVRHLRAFNDRRNELGIDKTKKRIKRPNKKEVEVTLQGPSGRVVQKLNVSTQWPTYGDWPRTSHARIGDVGYLRIPRMTAHPSFLDELDQTMTDFRTTKGLIIDLRGNGGGSRDVLKRLLPYFLDPSEPPVVVNVAAYRLPANQGDPRLADGYLANRSLYPVNWPGWSESEVYSIKTLSFKPEWPLPKNQFSAWHYFVLEHADNSKAYPYQQPVIILLDGSCFSATDIFLGAFKGRSNVTLMGTASGGGSGRALTYILPNSGLSLQLSSMASFRPNGQLYEGRGIQPDSVLEPEPVDFVFGEDSVLRTALERLRTAAHSK